MRGVVWHTIGPLVVMVVIGSWSYWIDNIILLVSYIGILLFIKIDNCEYYLENLSKIKEK